MPTGKRGRFPAARRPCRHRRVAQHRNGNRRGSRHTVRARHARI